MSQPQDTPLSQSSREEWEGLSREEQESRLQNRLEDSGEISQTPQLSETEQQSAMAALEAQLEETWTAEVQGVEMEFYRLSESQQDQLMEMAQTLFAVEGAGSGSGDGAPESAEDLPDNVIEELDRLSEKLPSLLADVTVEEGMSEEWWAAGNYPKGAKLDVFFVLFEQVTDHLENTQSFR